jgi:hypothetical protein
MAVRKVALVALALAIGAGAPAARAADPEKRPSPDYAGREAPPPTVGQTLLWVPRILFSPVYFVSEYLIRRPVGAVLIAAEQSNVPEVLYDFFTFGPDHKAGIAPVAFVDFGTQPSIGAYGFWDDAVFKGNDLRAHAVGWPEKWFGASVNERIRFGGNKSFTLHLAAMRRPDYTFYGIGPRTLESWRSRYGAETADASATFAIAPLREVKIEAGVGVSYANFYDGTFHHDLGILEVARTGAFPLPDGFAQGYVAEINHITAAFDSRRPYPESGSGFRVEADGQEGNNFGPGQPGGWIRYGAGTGGFLDLDGHRRVVSKRCSPTRSARAPPSRSRSW